MTQLQRNKLNRLNRNVSDAYEVKDQNTNPKIQNMLDEIWLTSIRKLESFQNKVFK